ncbi:MAG: YccF domain-containing protein [Desulfobacteraceae bacterium]|nr:YccF domain-containing protein [Desulfobacteraceae bacterium]
MALILNILWFVFGGGFLAWLLWILLGCLLFITVVGIPFGYAAFRIAGFAAFPFGKEPVDARNIGEKRVAGTSLANFLWIILAGIWLSISHIISGLSLCITIIGIPFGFAHFKLAGVCFAPLGKKVVPK